jgi:hypothetical protein
LATVNTVTLAQRARVEFCQEHFLLLRTGKLPHDLLMSDGEIKDELKAYEERLDALREDLKIVVKYSNSLRNSVLAIANQSGNRSFDQAEVKRCQEFRDKYQIRIGWSRP